MNILLIAHERKMGGANVCLYEIAKEMKSRGHNIYVVVLYRGCPIDIKLREIEIQTVPALFGWWQRPKNWNPILKGGFELLHQIQFISRRKLIKFVRNSNIEIIHSNSSVVDIGMQVARTTGVKHIWHIREYGDHDYNLEYSKGRKKSINDINRYSDRVVFISKALKEAYPEIDDNISRQVYDGVSKEYINYEGKIEHQNTTFLISGNLNRNKNQMIVLEACKILKNQGIADFNVKIAGESTSLKSSKNYKESLIKYIKDNDLTNVEMLGFVQDMKRLRQIVDVEIVASVSEAFGRVTVEAMLSHNLVIASNEGANIELVQNGQYGKLFNCNNSESLASEMKNAIFSKGKEKDICEQAYHYARNRFTIKKNVEDIEKIYKEVIF